MLSREELLLSLKRCRDEESRAVPVYGQNTANPLFLANLSAEEQSRVKSMLLSMKKESEAHLNVYDRLISEVEASEQDVF